LVASVKWYDSCLNAGHHLPAESLRKSKLGRKEFPKGAGQVHGRVGAHGTSQKAIIVLNELSR
jgi:hypothetical protein